MVFVVSVMMLGACMNVVRVRTVNTAVYREACDTPPVEAQAGQSPAERVAAIAAAEKARVGLAKDQKINCDSVQGIPFYAKKVQFRQSSVYVDTWLRVTLTVEKKLVDTATGKEVVIDSGTQQYTKDLANPPGNGLSAIKKKLLESSTADQSVANDIITDFNKLTDVDKTKPINPRITKNSIDLEWVVDYTRTYYLNAPLPWFGTGTLTQTLNGDGTLASATASADTKVADSLSTLVPFKEFLTGKFIKPAPAAATDDKEKGDVQKGMIAFRTIDPASKISTKQYVYALSLNVAEMGYEYALSSEPQAAPFTVITPITFTEIEKPMANFSRKSVGGADDEKKDERQKVGISGSVSFPKDWGAPPKP